ncbi:MAG: hydrogenase/urease maturation nickel metallochaperone HypA [Candidatus Omnitrophica bacterium]|nr:hydrogenase/urease maturation nickel metallochaperone HypA [Candidatus Omnitrophota bacterium]
MHEVGVAKEILSLVLRKSEGKKILRIEVELGNDGHTTPGSLRRAFQMIAKGTLAEEADLSIISTKALESRVVALEVES